MKPDQLEILKPLRRTAIVILYMIGVGGPVRVKKIADDLEIDYETCRSYVHELRESGIVVRTSAGLVMLSTLGQQLALPGMPVKLSAENPRFFITTTTTDIEESENQGVVVVNTADETRKNRVWETLMAVGVTKNKRTMAIVDKPHITPELVKSIISNMVSKGKTLPTWAGLLVGQLETDSREFHSENCRCRICDKRRIDGYKAYEQYNPPEEDEV